MTTPRGHLRVPVNLDRNADGDLETGSAKIFYQVHKERLCVSRDCSRRTGLVGRVPLSIMSLAAIATTDVPNTASLWNETPDTRLTILKALHYVSIIMLLVIAVIVAIGLVTFIWTITENRDELAEEQVNQSFETEMSSTAIEDSAPAPLHTATGRQDRG